MSRKSIRAGALLATVILALGTALPVSARVIQGLDLDLQQPEAAARSGQLFRGRLSIMADRDLQITEFNLKGDSWRGLTWTPVLGSALGKNSPLMVEFSGTPETADAPLTVSVQAGDKALRRTYALGGEDFEKRAGFLPTRLADFPVPAPWHSDLTRFQPAGPALPPDDLAADCSVDDFPEFATPRDPAKDRDIRIRGRFIYVREDGEILGADGMSVHVYDDDPIVDDYLGTGGTDVDGNFDFTVHWESQLGQPDPDLLLVLATENTQVQVRPVGSAHPYRFVFGPYNDYSGSDFNLGVGIPAHEEDNGIPHLITNYTRYWRYVVSHGHSIRFLEVRWPGDEEDGAYYSRVSETIQLAERHQWQSGTQAHEFGHHIMNCLSEMPDIEYCNDICDDNPPWDCGHCIWCEEEVPVAWSEGWADYTGHAIPRTFAAVYGTSCIHIRNMATIDTCDIDNEFGDPLITEGFTGALLADLQDDHQDDDPYSPGFADVAFLGHQALLDVLHSDHAQTTRGFLDDLMEHFPDQREDIWETAMNNGYDIDESPPDPVWPIVCLSHFENVPSANPTLRFYWQTPGDDASGVAGYSVGLWQTPVDPGTYMTLERENEITYEDLDPGTYYFMMRSVDRAGRWSADYTSVGPFIIVEPQPINLVFQTPEGWDFPVVPRNTEDVTLDSCPLPAALDALESTYWNLAGRNEGDLYTGADTYTAFLVDGQEKGRFNWGDLPGWCPFMVMNEGPEFVTGGLHTVTGSLDPDNLVAETDESDNLLGKQFAWRPPVIEPDLVYTNGLGVPDATAGWNTVDTGWVFYNCYGMTFNSSGWWNAFLMWSDDQDVDYDLRLHEVNENPLSGFKISAESSSQPAGWMDAVLVNRNQVGNIAWDAGIINRYGHGGSHRFQHLTSELVAFGDSLTETLGSDQYVMLREFHVNTDEAEGISLDLWTDPPQANVMFAWRDADFQTGSILEADAHVLTGADGHANLEVIAAAEGYTCLMICRQPMDGDDDLQVTYRIRAALPDLVPANPAGWVGPVVPRDSGDASSDEVTLSSILHGDSESTWFNYAVENAGAGTAWAAMRFYVMVDEGYGSFHKLYLLDIPGHETRTIINDGPRLIRSGRHTIVLDLDRGDIMVERDESNNAYGEQYVWSPPEMSSGDRATRQTPPDMIAGWSEVTPGIPLFYNCDGIRAADTSTYWRAIAVMPDEEADVDLRLHETSTSPRNGFGPNLARSSWGVGQSDFVLVNFNLTAHRTFDAGVLAVAGYRDYSVEVGHEYWLGNGAVDHGPVTMGEGEMLDLYEIKLPVGHWRVTLENTAGEVDWGLSFHPGDMPYLTKNDVLDGAAAWFAPGGMDEVINVTIETEAYCPIAVWKARAEDLDAAGTYILHVSEGAPSPVEETPLPTVTRMTGIYPNPFNPRTTVDFDLDRSAPVDLAVYDLTGRRVATLVRETLGAGRHRRIWRGHDDAGRQVASGMYFIRLSTDRATDLKKVMLVK